MGLCPAVESYTQYYEAEPIASPLTSEIASETGRFKARHIGRFVEGLHFHAHSFDCRLL